MPPGKRPRAPDAPADGAGVPSEVSDGVVDDEGRPTQLELIEIAQGVTIEDIKAATGCGFRVADGHRSRWLQPMMQEPSDIPPSRVAAP